MVAGRFYVYEHTRADTGEIFYVGKGQGPRAREGHEGRRSEYWKRVCSKAGGFQAHFVARDLDEELSLLAEVERIDQLRRLGVKLCNLTDGGEGGSGYKRPPELNEFYSRLHKGKVLSPETRAKISASVKASGYKPSPEAIAKIRAANVGHTRNVGRKQSAEEVSRRIASLKGWNGRTGMKHSAETKARMSAAHKGVPQPKVQCPHCQKVGGNIMRRYHFDNCKAK